MSEAAISMVIGDAIDPEKAKADARTARAFRAKAVQLAAWADRRVVNRRSAHGHYIAPESRRDPDLTAYTDKTPVTVGTLVEHFKAAAQGDIRGLHATARDEAGGPGEVAACWSLWGAKDIDRHAEGTDPGATLKAALAWYDRAVGLGFRPLLEDSDGRGGYHIWVFFDGPTPTTHVFRFLRWLGRDWKALGLDKEAESFPKQPAIEAGGYGNWLRLFGRHHTRAHWSRFWDGERWLDGQDAVDFVAGIAGDPAGLIPAEALVDPKPSRRAGATAKFTGEGDEAIAADALGYLDPTPYDDWIRYGMALHSRFGPSGLALWDHWSQGAKDSYDPGACDRKWSTFNPNGGVKVGTLLAEAKQRGWPGQKPAECLKATTALRLVRGDEPPPEVPAKRPEITVSTEEHEIIDQAIMSLRPEANLFQQGGRLVRVVRQVAAERKAKDIHRPSGTPRIVDMPLPRLREIMAQRAAWFRWIRDGNSMKRVAAHPPEWAYLGLNARGGWPADCIRPLEGIVEAPTLRPDWSILDTPGWDAETGLLYEPNCAFLPIPDRPTRTEAKAAADLLLELVADFPFVDQSHRVVWLSALLTMLVRSAIDGPTPLFMFDANVPGIGKTKLCDLLSIIVCGRDISRSGYPRDEAEMAKAMFAVALGGDRAVMFDNVKSATSVGGETIDRVLTATTIKGRVLGKSESLELPWIAVMLITGNNMGVTGDGMRRIAYSAMNSEEERPEERKSFTIPGNILTHARRNRARYVQAALTILRGYHAAGCPDPNLVAIDYTAWCEVVRNAVYWSTDHDPCATRSGLRESDPESQTRTAVIEGWSQLNYSERGVTVAEALKYLKDDPGKFDTLRNVFMGWSKNDELPGSAVIGHRLKPLKGRVINGKMLTAHPYQGTLKWSIVQVGSRGDGGDRGDDLHTPGVNSVSVNSRGEEPNLPSSGCDHPHHPHHPHGAPPSVSVLAPKATGRRPANFGDPDREVVEL